jgi:hypothetical protein
VDRTTNCITAVALAALPCIALFVGKNYYYFNSRINDAKAGMIMPGKIEIGLKYYQELAKGIDEGRAEIVGFDYVIDTRAGEFQQVLKNEESTPLEPGRRSTSSMHLG